MKKRMLRFAPLALAAAALFVTLGGELVRLLWNSLLPALFGWPRITFWQALGVLALSRILFGGFGGRCAYGSGFRRRMEQMSPEERERFRQGMRERFGLGPQ